jgi:uncharacterized repeat protein (TIGR03803 family)
LFFTLTIIALISVSSAQAQTYTFSTLYSFKNNGTDPANPMGYPTVDSSGNVYGTSQFGGSDRTDCTGGCGSVFKVTKAGVMAVLHNFGDVDDPGGPLTGLVRDKAGNLYGTTQESAFKLTPSGAETILHSFPIGSIDGFYPNDVTLDSAGNLYGTTENGGTGGDGVVFKIDTANTYSVLHNFCPNPPACLDGEYPVGRLVRDAAGDLYGVTVSGGTDGYGTVFKLTEADVESVLHSSNGTSDGYNLSGLTQDKQGKLYGVNALGGKFSKGTLFSLPESGGALSTLYNFCSLSRCADGETPLAPIQLDSAGNIYGTAYTTANKGCVVWEVTSAGKLVTLHTFSLGINCVSGLSIDSTGNLVGFTENGGASGLGSVFKLTLAK